ncbi:MAG: hypothetical protein ABI811_13155 [Acidobacteriota bacterium]
MSKAYGFRLEALRKAQNADGGWAFYSGKRSSWLEPTVYAALALHGEPAAERAWNLVRSWQQPEGGWRSAADLQESCWTTALYLTLAAARGESGAAVESGARWVLEQFSGKGWSWQGRNSPAVEPTAHTLVALRRFAKAGIAGPFRERIKQGEEFLLDSGLDRETTGLTLLGLQSSRNLGKLPELAAQWALETPSPLAKAWIGIGLRLLGTEPPVQAETAPPRNLAILALETLAASDGNYRFFRTEGLA